MKPTSWLLTLGLIGCVVLAIAFVRAKRDLEDVTLELRHLTATTAALRPQLVMLRTEAAKSPPTPIVALEAIGSGRTPAAVTRAKVASLLAQLRAEHDAHPRPPRRPPPPSGPQGMNFPELLADPQYNLLTKQYQRLFLASLLQAKFEHVGLSAAESERVLDLLAEREMVRLDYQSLRSPRGANSRLYQQQEAERARLNEQIRTLLGPTRYDRLATKVPSVSIVSQPNGTVTESQTMTAEITPWGNATFDRLTPLQLRLSYSTEPLRPEQSAALNALCQSNPAFQYAPWRLEAFIEAAKPLLSPVQFAALNELKAQEEATRKRGRLPN